MEKQEFIRLIQEHSDKWEDVTLHQELTNIISYCYDVLCSDEELGNISTELTKTRQRLEELRKENATLETYKSGYSRLYAEIDNYKKELAAYKGIVRAQNVLIELK